MTQLRLPGHFAHSLPWPASSGGRLAGACYEGGFFGLRGLVLANNHNLGLPLGPTGLDRPKRANGRPSAWVRPCFLPAL